MHTRKGGGPDFGPADYSSIEHINPLIINSVYFRATCVGYVSIVSDNRIPRASTQTPHRRIHALTPSAQPTSRRPQSLPLWPSSTGSFMRSVSAISKGASALWRGRPEGGLIRPAKATSRNATSTSGIAATKRNAATCDDEPKHDDELRGKKPKGDDSDGTATSRIPLPPSPDLRRGGRSVSVPKPAIGIPRETPRRPARMSRSPLPTPPPLPAISYH